MNVLEKIKVNRKAFDGKSDIVFFYDNRLRIDSSDKLPDDCLEIINFDKDASLKSIMKVLQAGQNVINVIVRDFLVGRLEDFTILDRFQDGCDRFMVEDGVYYSDKCEIQSWLSERTRKDLLIDEIEKLNFKAVVAILLAESEKDKYLFRRVDMEAALKEWLKA